MTIILLYLLTQAFLLYEINEFAMDSLNKPYGFQYVIVCSSFIAS